MRRAAAWVYRVALAILAGGAALLAVRVPPLRGAMSLAALVLLGAHYLFTAARLPALFHGHSALTDEVLASCPSLAHRFWPTPWCFNGHLQLALMVHRDTHEAPLHFDQSERLRLADGGTVSLDWLGPADATDAAPLLVVLPSLCGDGQSLRGFVREMRALLGWSVVVLNRRGHGDLPLTAPRFNTLGSTDDLRAQLRHVREQLPASPLYVLGVSAGSGLLVRYLGEEGGQTPVTAGVALCPGYDTTRAFTRVHRGYDRYMVRQLREYFLDRHQAVLSAVDGYAETRASRSVAEFHERAFRLSGFASVTEYHRATNPMAVMDGVRVPLLVLNAADDPVCVVENVREHLGVVDVVPETILALTARGSHCAFYEGVLQPRSWACRVIAEYLAAVHAVRAEATTRSTPLAAAATSAVAAT